MASQNNVDICVDLSIFVLYNISYIHRIVCIRVYITPVVL
jgi:hypothetical protein